MRSFVRALFLALTTSLLAAAPAAAAPPEKEVLAAMDVWKDAMLKKDRAALDKVFHPDLSYGHSSGVIETKAQAIEHVVAGGGTYLDIKLTDTKVRAHGSYALATGKVDIQERANGKEQTANLVVLTVWTKGPKGWQMIGRQATKLPPPAPPPPAPPAAPAAPPAH